MSTRTPRSTPASWSSQRPWPRPRSAARPADTCSRPLVAGYDVVVRVARAAGVSHYAHWHTTGTCGTFGAAAAAGSILGLDPAAMTMALGLAGTQAAGLWESLNGEATMAKHLHGGKAASSGLLAALLARGGFRGSPSILEGNKGFLAAASAAGPEELKGLTAGFGRPFLITRNFFKRYACCRACFEGIQALQALRERGVAPVEAVRRITVTMRPHRLWLVGVRRPPRSPTPSSARPSAWP